MSQEALCFAVRDKLRANLVGQGGTGPLQENECDVAVSGRPKPMSPEEFIGVHDDGWDSYDQGDQDITETFSVLVTVSWRVGAFGVSDMASQLLYRPGGPFATRIRQVIGLVHKKEDVRLAADQIIKDLDGVAAYEDLVTNPFLTHLVFRRVDTAVERDAQWFWASPAKGEGGVAAPHGYSRTIRFERALRIQPVGDIE